MQNRSIISVDFNAALGPQSTQQLYDFTLVLKEPATAEMCSDISISFCSCCTVALKCPKHPNAGSCESCRKAGSLKKVHACKILNILLVPPLDMPPGSTSSSSSLAFLSSQLEEARDNQVKERPGQKLKVPKGETPEHGDRGYRWIDIGYHRI